MSLRPGTRIGPYEVIALIGEGGMGEVWRAHHTALKREDALKVLPDAFVSDSERLARFEREAQVLASLNHPHIAHVYGLEQANGVQALVMELVEGPTLADRIATGPIPLDEALPIATQIAHALEAAHERGIVHRDLKPANIKVRADGTVKVLDFGLAKALGSDSAGGPSGLSNSPTITSPATMTGVGVLLGTAAYMAPEQARGRPVDKRADIWAFGCVLYEMLTGRRTFQADDVTDTIAFVLTREPDWAAPPQNTPPFVRKLLRRCLQKDAKQRFQHIGDVRIELEESNTALTEEGETSRRPGIALVFAVGLGLGLLVATLIRSSSAAPARAPIEQLSMLLQSDNALRDGPSVAISRDGRRVAYVADRDGVSRLFVRDLAWADGRVLVETGQPWMPFFSPDGESIGFFASGKLQRVAVSGGTPLVLCDAPYPLGGTWGTDDLIVFAPTIASALLQISANGGTPKPLTSLDKENGVAGHRWPQLLPGNRAVLFAAGPAGSESNFNEARIEVQSLETGEHHVVSRGTYPRYVSSGHLLYVDNDTIFARLFDLKAMAAVGASVPVLEHVDVGAAGQKPFDVSVNGTVVYTPGVPELPQPIFVVDATGAMRQLPFAPARFRQPKVSPDGQYLVVGVVATDADLWAYDMANGARTRLTSGGSNRAATWTHDGRRVIYAATRSATTSLYRRSADASTPEEKLAAIGALARSVSLFPDDHTLLFDTPGDTVGKAFRLDLADPQHPRPWVSSPSGEEFITVSPDGEWVAYLSNQSGRPEVYVRSSSGKGGGVQVSIAGGRAPVWAHSGRELFFLDWQRSVLMVASVTTKPTLTVGAPRRIMSSGSTVNLAIDAYDVMPDDRHFVIVRNTNPDPLHELSIITNWTEELKARVPTK